MPEDMRAAVPHVRQVSVSRVTEAERLKRRLLHTGG